MGLFLEFIDRKEREVVKHLKILEKLLKSQNFKVKHFFKFEDSYLFIKNLYDDQDVGGIRIYQLGDIIAYRLQKEAKTEPYGAAYPLNVEKMFEDLLEDHDPKEAAKALIKVIAIDIKHFFKETYKAEKKLTVGNFDISPNNPMNRIVSRVGGSVDYSNLINLPK